MPSKTLALPLATAALLTLGGCLISSSNSTYESGRRVGGETLSQIVVDETTEPWLIAAIGEPSSRVDVDGRPGVQILRYDHVVRKESGGAFLFVYAGASSSSTSTTTYFEVTDGVITRHWTE